MGIQATSADAYREEKTTRMTQEKELMKLLDEHHGGMSDRQIADAMGITCALASARRNGVTKKLAESNSSSRVSVVCRGKDSITGKTVNFWAIRKVDEIGTRPLF